MQQALLHDEGAARGLLDTLLQESALYRDGKDYKDLLNFVVRLRNFAPFNAMLLQLQKPGLSYAASALDWAERFGRYPKPAVRPLLILWPFGPVAFVYDVIDTEGRELPADVSAFLSTGPVGGEAIDSYIPLLRRRHIDWVWADAGDNSAGAIALTHHNANGKGGHCYRLTINRNHPPPVQFTSISHELAHLFLGHLDEDSRLKIPERRTLTHREQELEAESVAYLVCARNGVASKSQVYLSQFVTSGMDTDDLDLYQIMRAAGQVETVLGLSRPTKIPMPNRR